MKRIISRFGRSPLGIVLWSVGVFAATALILGGRLPVFAVVLLCLLGVAAAAVLLLLSPLGARAVSAERDRDRADRDARVLGGVAAARKRLSLLRIGSAEVKAELDRLVFAAGRYLENAVKTDERDPIAEDAVLGAVEVVNDYLQLADSESSSRRGAGSEPGNADLVGRTVRALAASAEEIERRLDPGAASDRLAAREELR